MGERDEVKSLCTVANTDFGVDSSMCFVRADVELVASRTFKGEVSKFIEILCDGFKAS